MNKIFIIIKREYLTRVKKKSFIIMSIIGPLLMAALIVAPVWLGELDEDKVYKIGVIDQTKNFDDMIPNAAYLANVNASGEKIDPEKATIRRLPDSKNYKFTFIDSLSKAKAIEKFNSMDYDVLLFIPYNISSSENVEMYSSKDLNLATKLYITKILEKDIEKEKLKAYGIEKPIRTSINVLSTIISKEGDLNESSTELKMALGAISGILIYMFVFMYGAQVMRGVIEEKTNRIIEVIVSSVKPFQLMMGKIVGVAMVGFTQFVLWMLLTFVIVSIVQVTIMPSSADLLSQQLPAQDIMGTSGELGNVQDINPEVIPSEFNKVFDVLLNIDWLVILSSFLFFFLAGYLLYASLFAAIGAAVDNDADTQQFMLPVTIPLILAMVMMQNIIKQPDGDIAFWFSMIPLTSPIVMMIRIPFGVPEWQVFLSMGILIVSFILSTRFAAKIYRIGILMYGKKVNYKELWKWLKYK